MTIGISSPALANHLWQSTLFALTVWLATFALRRNQARMRYRLWFAASVKFLLPFALLIQLGGLLPRPSQAILTAQPSFYSAADILTLPFDPADQAVSQPASPEAPTLAERLTSWLPAALLVVWTCGMVTVLLVWMMRWRRISGSLRNVEPVQEGRELAILRQVDLRLPLLCLPQPMEPGIFGVFRPVLLWPEGLTDRLDDDQIEAILLHELMHVWRRDNLTAALHMLVEAIFWFHPMVWWIERRLIEERERACDEAVLRLGGSPEAYAEGLLETCRFCIESQTEPALACVSGITGAALNQRILAIMSHRLGGRLGVGKTLLLMAAGVTAIAAPFLFGQAHAALHAAILAAPQHVPPPPPPPPPSLPPSKLLSSNDHALPLPQPPSPQAPAPASEKLSISVAPYDVASIRISHLNSMNQHVKADNRSMLAENATLGVLIRLAYNLPRHMLVGGPAWIEDTKFNIQAKTDGASTPVDPHTLPLEEREVIGPQRLIPLQKLLEDRFELKMHREDRAMPMYALVVAKGGLKIRPSNEKSDLGDLDHANLAARVFGVPGIPGIRLIGKGKLIAAKVTLDQLAQFLTGGVYGDVDRPVVNKAGLSGRYDFELDWTPGLNSDDSSAPSLFTAIQEQLGLKLEPQKGPVNVTVIDHAELPSEN